MKLGIGPYYYSRYGAEAGGEKMREHGYEYMDFDWYANTDSPLYAGNDEEFVAHTTALREKFLEAGIKVRQIHGPWRSPIRDGTPEDRAERFEKMSRALHAASILGAEYMAIHPIMPFGVEKHTEEQEKQLFEMNVEFFSRLAGVGERLGVYVCLENMPFPDFPISSVIDIMRVVKAVNNPYMRVCLDTGHANIVKPAPDEAVRIIGKDYLAIMHVHGNNGTADSHSNPHGPSDTVDWQAFADALREIGFEGVLNLETSPRMYSRPEEEREAVELALAAITKDIAGA